MTAVKIGDTYFMPSYICFAFLYSHQRPSTQLKVWRSWNLTTTASSTPERKSMHSAEKWLWKTHGFSPMVH